MSRCPDLAPRPLFAPVLALVCALGVNCPPAAAGEPKPGGDDFPALAQMLPGESVTADVMQARPPARAAELSQRFQEAVAKKPQWWSAYLKEHAETRPLPYHENFGLTQDEYKQMLALSKQFQLVKTGEVKLKVRPADDRLGLEIVGASAAVQPIRFELAEGGLETPLGRIDKHTRRDSGEQGGLLGHHRSYNWQSLEGDVDSGTYTALSLTVGRVTKTKRHFLQYRATQAKGGQAQVRFDLLLFY